MKFLLRSAMLLMFALFIGNIANAQTREAPVKTDVSELSASLDLTPEQTSQIEALELTFAEKKMEIKSITPNADDAGSKLKELKASYLKELSAILTPDQLEKWRAMQPQDGK